MFALSLLCGFLGFACSHSAMFALCVAFSSMMLTTSPFPAVSADLYIRFAEAQLSYEPSEETMNFFDIPVLHLARSAVIATADGVF